MEREILAYIKQNRMIGKNDVVLAGVSGGSDSMAMLRILKELQGKLDFTLRVVHIHHGIRGKEAVRITNLRSFSNQSQNPAIYSTEESGLVKVLFSFREFHS